MAAGRKQPTGRPAPAPPPLNPGDVAQAAVSAESSAEVASRLGISVEDLIRVAEGSTPIKNILDNALGAAVGRSVARRKSLRWREAERRTLAAEPTAQVVQVADVTAFELPHIFAEVHPPPGVDLVWSLDTGSCRCYLVSHGQV